MTKAMLANNGFKIGLFSANSSSGFAVTKVPERWSGSWDDNLKMAKIADQVGIDFLLPIARWIGFGGATNYHGGVLETLTWAGGLLAQTENISVFSTVHTAFNHPVVAAKQLATLDQIGHGRAGLNIVAGWNKPEYDVFGVDLPNDHDDRYRRSQEWWDIVRKTWTDTEPFDHNGEFFTGKQIIGDPRPFDGILPVFNAGSSPQGRDFAAHNADFVFTNVKGAPDAAEVVTALKSHAQQQYGRTPGVLAPAHVVCRSTRSEAYDYLHYYAEENADWEAVDNMMRLQGMHSQSFTPEMLATFRTRFAAGHGSIPLYGSPDDVADEIERFSVAGMAGLTIAFVDYISELEYFAQEVLPRLERKGIRVPNKAKSMA
ncbi:MULTISPECIES: LLM class flavin-dependent oxidoreductase [Rhodococcus]|uniref:LLM class flavin-dependent oxidoreductase n=1 Tax=Rhodococcus TaxID=1827 RepID=UPI0009789224|nr:MULTISPECIES: LLM class flavin-dependent oxidoreductase [Rhodococcus]OMQ23882.1 monooxygenase [Rhodococcus sp. D-1]